MCVSQSGVAHPAKSTMCKASCIPIVMHRWFSVHVFWFCCRCVLSPMDLFLFIVSGGRCVARLHRRVFPRPVEHLRDVEQSAKTFGFQFLCVVGVPAGVVVCFPWYFFTEACLHVLIVGDRSRMVSPWVACFRYRCGDHRDVYHSQSHLGVPFLRLWCAVPVFLFGCRCCFPLPCCVSSSALSVAPRSGDAVCTFRVSDATIWKCIIWSIVSFVCGRCFMLRGLIVSPFRAGRDNNGICIVICWCSFFFKFMFISTHFRLLLSRIGPLERTLGSISKRAWEVCVEERHEHGGGRGRWMRGGERQGGSGAGRRGGGWLRLEKEWTRRSRRTRRMRRQSMHRTER